MRKILIKNGRVWDGLTLAPRDIYVEYDKVVAIEPTISCDAQYTVDAKGCLVSAGLVDIHAHLTGLTTEKFAAPADLSCLPFGVTAVAEAGCSVANKALAESFLTHTFVFCVADIQDNQLITTNTEKLLAHYDERALGIKLYFDTNSANVWDTTPILQAREFVRARGLKIMVHCTGSPVPMMELVDALDPGDIISHAFHGGKNNAAEDNFACLRKAKEKGIVVDAGFAGNVHTDFQVFADSVRAGILPDTISTDLTRRSIYKRGGRYSLLQCMSMAAAMGMNEEDILRATTTNAAKALGRPELGMLKPGSCADLALLDWTEQPFDLTDSAGNRLAATYGWRCRMTMAGGNIVYAD